MLSPGEDPKNPEYGVLVGQGVNAQYHQHMFNARLDMAIDCPRGGAGLVVRKISVLLVRFLASDFWQGREKSLIITDHL